LLPLIKENKLKLLEFFNIVILVFPKIIFEIENFDPDNNKNICEYQIFKVFISPV